ncbi:MAG: DUF362 domain-containing protein [Candidatus Hydrothermarchaeota archaeon]|nr:DUF362 domain-containing protein [Candidatus Hydrothermarchaeota archaeon]
MIFTSTGLGRYENLRAVLQQVQWRSKGKTLLKPNLVAGGSAATHPEALRAVLDSLDVDIIAEGSAVDTKELYSSLGYKKLAKDYGVELIDLNESREWEEIEFLDIEKKSKKVRVSNYAGYDVVSLTLPKTHDHAVVTLTLKNVLGFVHPEDRPLVHGYAAAFGKVMRIKPLRKIASSFSRFKILRRLYSSTEVEEEKYIKGAKVIHKNIAALVKYVKPKLGIIDGYLGMEGNGPVAGDTFVWNIAIAGEPLECDVYCAHLMGFDAREIGYLHYLNAPPLEEIKIIGSAIERKKFAPHFKISLQMMWRNK